MIIIGCDWHVRFEQIALLDTETGEVVEQRLEHDPNPSIKEEGEVRVVGDGSGQRLGMERVGELRRSLIRVEEITPARWGNRLDSRHAQTRQAFAHRIPDAV